MLILLPCLDSPEMADTRHRELWIPRVEAAALGESALDAMRRGSYVSGSGRVVDWSHAVEAAAAGKVSIRPDTPLPPPPSRRFEGTRVQVANETTLGAAARLYGRGSGVVALNFANGISPGGGFLGGARAQEEVLCRSSALFATLVGDEMYAAHRLRPRPDSSDWAIYSPDVPVFRTDDGRSLEQPWSLSFITCAAPYAPAIGQRESGDLLQRRIHRVLEIARAYGHTAVVLGAWGCGAFGNDPARTAADFRAALEGPFDGAFGEVVFAVTDWSPERAKLGLFREVFT